MHGISPALSELVVQWRRHKRPTANYKMRGKVTMTARDNEEKATEALPCTPTFRPFPEEPSETQSHGHCQKH